MYKSTVKVSRGEIAAAQGAVSTGHELSADAGVAILQAGGNAVDAAVAAAFVGGVVEPWNCGIGGHGFASVYLAAAKRAEILNWVTKAPRAASPRMYELEEGSDGLFSWPRVRGDAQNVGYLAAEMPASAGGLLTLLERFGTMAPREVLEPAITLASEGYPVDWRTAFLIGSALEEMRDFPELGAIYAKDGLPPKAGSFYARGDRLVLTDLAKTLARMAAEGADFIYRGDVAERIANEVTSHGGIITTEDLAELQPEIESEARSTYRSAEYITGLCPIIVEVLNILSCFDLSKLEPNHPTYRHLMLEAMRQAWVDCLTYLGDPHFVEAPWAGLLSKTYAAAIADTIDLRVAAPSRAAGNPWQHQDRPAPVTAPRPGIPGEGTLHTSQVVCADADGNMVSLEHSLGNHFGSKVAIPGTGIVLGNGMISFDPRPGRPQSVAPGKRPFKIAPAVLMWRAGQPYASICASGGRRTTSAALHIMVNLIDFNMRLQAAIEEPRVHAELGDVFVDDRLPDSTRKDLCKMGHRLTAVHEDVAQANFGRPSAVLINPVDGRRIGGGDPLRSAGVAGY